MAETRWAFPVFSLAAIRAVIFGWGGACACVVASALDLDGVKPPREIVDQEVKIGARTLRLPSGHWMFVDRSAASVSGGPGPRGRSVVDTAYLVHIEDRTLVASVRIALPRNDIVMPAWNYPCLSANALTIYRQDRESPPGNADCVFIGGRLPSDLDAWLQGYSAPAKNWLTEAGVRLPGTTISIGYLRFSANTFGTIWVLARAEDFDSDAAAIEWAESLRISMKPMFEHRTEAARLPLLPSAAASAGSPP